MVVLALVLAGVISGWTVARSRGQRDSVACLAEERTAREELRRAVAATNARLDAVQGELASTATVLRGREARLGALARRLSGLERGVQAGERLLQGIAAGVALIQATVRYEDAAGRPLRYRGAETRRPWRGVLGPPPVGVEGDGAVVTTTFLGTGFLVGRDGTVLTSRHVVRPWETEDDAAVLEELGVVPRLADVRAFFPGLVEPVSLRPGHASDTADVMVLTAAVPPGTVPILPLDETPPVPGRPVIVIGYPGGLELLLARVEPAVLRTLIDPDVPDIADDTVDVPGLLAELARRRLIRPHASWGHVVDVRPHLLTYDARTAIGASGAPILDTAGRVIGVNQAVLPDFVGVAFGVPIRHGRALLRDRPLPPGPGGPRAFGG
jgi:S1-C subfamily serine protease